jgi:hypothetical protein
MERSGHCPLSNIEHDFAALKRNREYNENASIDEILNPISCDWLGYRLNLALLQRLSEHAYQCRSQVLGGILIIFD